MMTALSFGTGALDAATYLGMERVFGANMTGNVIVVGLALTGAEHIPLLGPLAALGGFIAGSWVLGQILRRFPPSGRADTTLVSLFWISAGGMLAVATALSLLPSSETLFHVVTFAIGLLMGCQAIAARRVGVPDISTVVITSTLSLLFSEAGRFRGGVSTPATRRRLAAVGSMFLGAIAGAFLLHLGLGLGVALLLPAAILSGVAIVYTVQRMDKKNRADSSTALVST
jgi:uncharacterized membrane protein YoaK (UPF0700 family)